MSFLIAHRGHSALAPENTLASFSAAVEHGFAWVETDVDLLADGTLVLFHDLTLERTTDGTGPLAALRAEDLGTLDAGSHFSADFAGEPVPTLGALVNLMNARGLNANLELKLSQPTPDRVELFVDALDDALEALAPWREVIVSSFDHDVLAAFHRHRPQTPTACLFHPDDLAEDRPEGWHEAVTRTGARFVHPFHGDLTKTLAAEFLAASLGINAWTVNDPERAAQLVAWGVEGLCTDGFEGLTPATFRAGDEPRAVDVSSNQDARPLAA